MEVELTNRIFEWLLAGWTGHRDDPGEVFPSLRDEDISELAMELDLAISRALRLKKVI